jgi:hypothetical protein
MCTGCHAALAPPDAQARHTHHDSAGAGGSCVGCHMPRIVYGVLDIHPSHRIEIPDPARAARAGRPDACTGCHVDRDAGWAESAARTLWGGDRYSAGAVVPGGSAPQEAIFGGEPVARAVAADALGRAPPAHDRVRRVEILLEVMARDRYPAVRHLAWRSLRRLAVPGAQPNTGLGAGYDPSGGPAGRARVVARLREALGVATTFEPTSAQRAASRDETRDSDLEIGE